MSDRSDRARREAIRAEYLDEETAAAQVEAAENEQAVMSVRVPAALAEGLRSRAATEHIPTSALVRRILTDAVEREPVEVLTVRQVEEIARRVFRESA